MISGNLARQRLTSHHLQLSQYSLTHSGDSFGVGNEDSLSQCPRILDACQSRTELIVVLS